MGLTGTTVVPVNFHEIPLESWEIMQQVKIDSAAEAMTHIRLSCFLPSAALATGLNSPGLNSPVDVAIGSLGQPRSRLSEHFL